jgi:hypothetical protein
MNIKLRKKNELQYIPGSVKELFGEGGGNEKKQFQRISSIKKPTEQPSKLFKALVCNRPNHKSKLGTHL